MIDDQSFARCIRCSKQLIEMPRIFVEDHIYCFRCAKTIVKDGQYNKLKLAQGEYLSNLDNWEKEQNKFELLHSIWGSARSEYVVRHLPKFLVLKAILVSICLWILATDAHFLIPVIIVSLIFHHYIKSKKEITLESEFAAEHPEPNFTLKKPSASRNIDVTHFPVLLGNDIIYSKNIIREEILKRDHYVCQNCETKKSASELEVHHVVPKSKGGIDSPYNLITLCKHCHDRETWYGHIRVHPTTIKEDKPTRRKGRFRRYYW